MSWRTATLHVPQAQAINIWFMERLPNLYKIGSEELGVARRGVNTNIAIVDTDLWVSYDTAKPTARRTDRHMRLHYRVEVKCKSAARTVEQTQLDRDIDLLARTEWPVLREAGRFVKGQKNFRPVIDPVDNALVRFLGSHLLQVSNETPENSDWMYWDAKQITLDQLVGLLNFELNPDTLQVMNFDDPMHKPRIQDTLPGMG